jgi:dTDP-4-dehydrorhamnose reductase
MKVLVVGAAGQVGRSLVAQFDRRGDVVIATFNSRPPGPEAKVVVPLNKTDPEQVRTVLGQHRPDVVVDTGALHNVDYCETHPDEAFAVNRDGTRALAEGARTVGARFVFVSTDFVFDGQKSGPYVESDPPAPVSVYAQSKLEGEVATMRAASTNIVARPSVIYSWLATGSRQASSSGKGMNFGTWAVEEVAHGRPIRIIQDQLASPTLAEDLAGALVALVGQEAGGVFHAAGATATNRYDFTSRLVKGVGLDPSLVQPVRTSDLNQKARRPLNSSLSSDKLFRATGYRTLALPEAIDRFVADLRADPQALGGKS